MASCQGKASRESLGSGMLPDYCFASVKNRAGMVWDFISINEKSSVQASLGVLGLIPAALLSCHLALWLLVELEAVATLSCLLEAAAIQMCSQLHGQTRSCAGRA